MEFRVKTEPPHIEPTPPGARVFSIGSCFAESIAARLAVSGFPIVSNPFGVLYNPASIAGAIDILDKGRQFGRDDLVQNNGIWCSPLFHGSFSGADPDAFLAKMNRAATEGQRALAAADLVLISFGTPWVYTVSERFSAAHQAAVTGSVVANCHRFPSGYYERRRMTVDEIVCPYRELSRGPLRGKRVIYTVSPVRYVKDGLHGSNLGKAVLHLAVEQICGQDNNAYYFPAYEILTDELRDYRFYGEDMVHPSHAAVQYIWELFRQWALTPEATRAAVEIEKLSAAMTHRVQQPGSAAHLDYLRSMAARAAELARKYPAADLSSQISYFADKIAEFDGR